MSRFPKPTGKYAVGCTDVISKCGRDRCFFRLFYPAKNADFKHAEWLPSQEYADGFMDFLKMKPLSFAFRFMFSGITVPAGLNTDLLIPDSGSKLPVAVFTHGLGANRTTYSNICIELASHGTVVAAVEHGDESASATYYLEQDEKDGEKFKKVWMPFQHVSGKDPNEHEIRNKQVHSRADDCISVLNHMVEINSGTFSCIGTDFNLQQFEEKLDLERIAILGHSFGGGSAIAALAKDNRFKVAVALDSWMFPLDKNVYKDVSSVPILFVNSESFHWPSNISNIRKLDQDTFDVSAERKIVTVLGSVHQSHSDFPLLVKWSWLAQKFKLQGAGDPLQMSKIHNELLVAFIGKHLNLAFGQELDKVIEKYKQQILVGSNVAVDEEKIADSKQQLISLI